MRFLGVDFGGARIGLAVGESEFGITTARPNIASEKSLAKNAELLSKFAKREDVERIVLGIPLYSDDRMANVCRQLGEQLKALGWHVELVDESYTSVEAETDLRQYDLKASQRRKLRDGEAARRILERFFIEQAGA